RGICALRPGVPGVSDNIRVVSVIDRFLEHSRIYYFESGGTPEVYVGSADWMDRNLIRRVEVVFPVEQPDLKARVIEILAISLTDTAKAQELHADGSYTVIRPAEGAKPVRSQLRFLDLAAEAARAPVVASATPTPTSIEGGPKLLRRPGKPRKGG
ncbi:MAG: RNA degradosome polyphosphate kinase, partial [Fimbriiglobus sp.]